MAGPVVRTAARSAVQVRQQMTWAGFVEPSAVTELQDRADRLRRIARALGHDLATLATEPERRALTLGRIIGLRRDADLLDAELVRVRGY